MPFHQTVLPALGGLATQWLRSKIEDRVVQDQRAVITSPTMSTPPIMAGSVLGQLPSVLRTGGRIIQRNLPAIAGGAVAGQALEFITDEAGNIIGRRRKRRRMNPFNPKAARRAGRRLRALQREMKKIERSLPTRTITRRAPAGHRARLSHT